MIKLLKRFRVLVICAFVSTFTFVLLTIIPTSYDLTVPAYVDDIRATYSFEGVDTSDVNVSSVSVFSYYNISILNYLQAKLNPFAVVEKHNEYVNTSIEYGYTSGTIQKNVSLTNSIIAGYRHAGKEINATFKGNIVHSIFGLEESVFRLGDIIIECEGTKVLENYSMWNILQDLYGIYEANDGEYYINIVLNKEYTFKVLRNNEEITLKTEAFPYVEDSLTIASLGINCYSAYSISNYNTNPKYQINAPDSYGPSAGLMQALFIYDAISGEQLTKDLHIVGTGTIDAFGKVGIIGGVKAKVVAAHLAKADIFFVPSGNYDEAYESYSRLKTAMKLVEVNSLMDVINYLKEYKEQYHD